MPRVNVEHRTVLALCYHFGHSPAFALDSSCLARAVRGKLPEAEIIRGTAASEDKSVPCSWVRVGGRDYDVQLIAQRRRAQVSHCLKCDGTWPTDRVLAAGEGGGEGRGEDSDPDEHTKELENWTLPTCAACCGQNKAHTLDAGCASPWKAEHLSGRVWRRCARLGCHRPGSNVQGHKSRDCYDDMEAISRLSAVEG
jgi:hypothetical protein